MMIKTEKGEFKQEDTTSALYDESYSKVDKIIQNVKRGISFSIDEPAEIVNKFIESLVVNDTLIRKALFSKTLSLDIPSHLLNVCIFALEIGMGLNYKIEELKRLGLVAILHDLGMAKIPEGILKKPGKLSTEEFTVVKKHPEEGADILKSLGKNYLWISEIVVQEHERFDGKGYPHGLKGNEIHEYALIIGISDVYEALTHHRFQRRNLPPFDSMKEILSVERSSFPKKIIKALLAKLPVFPVGTMVRLNSQETGIVVSTDSYSPFRPTVEIILDPSGNKSKTKRIINLKENSLLYIISLVSEEEIYIPKG